MSIAEARAHAEQERDEALPEPDRATGLRHLRDWLNRHDNTDPTLLEHLPEAPDGDCWQCRQPTSDRRIIGIWPLCRVCAGHRIRVHHDLERGEK